MTFRDENNNEVSSRQDMMFVSVESEDDYMSALEQLLDGYSDIEVKYNGPGLYLPDDEIISGDVYITLAKVEDKAKELAEMIGKLEREIRLYKYSLGILEGVSAAS